MFWMNNILSETAVAFFRERLRKADVIKELISFLSKAHVYGEVCCYDKFEGYLRAQFL